ncbi:MAG: acyl-CoA dehydrogenase, partial [Deltaproteobacteria bacterium]|nr:acyl-CoA dehydrogenase [Deltaproteobacteria bacterium]
MNNLELSDKYKPILKQVKEFIANEIDPLTPEFYSEVGLAGGDRWKYTDRM